jgi:hypothetical protein
MSVSNARRSKRRTYYSCNSKNILKAEVLPTILPNPHEGSRSYANDGAPKEKEDLHRQHWRFVHFASIHCCCLKIHGKCLVLRRYCHHLQLLFVTHKVRSKVGSEMRRKQFATTQGNRGNLSFNEAQDQAIQKYKRQATCPPPALSSPPRPTHEEGSAAAL